MIFGEFMDFGLEFPGSREELKLLDRAAAMVYNPPLFGAGLAQLVVHLICNQGVGGSNPSAGTNKNNSLRAPVRRT